MLMANFRIFSKVTNSYSGKGISQLKEDNIMANFRIFGKITNSYSRKGISQLKVEVWDKDGKKKDSKKDDLCGIAITDQKGAYEVTFDQSAFKDSYKDILPDVYFNVFQGDELILSTRNAVCKNVPVGDTEINLEIELIEPSAVVNENSITETDRKKSVLLATGLEDYGKWLAIYQNHQRDENEKPFRRGRIWC